jgi:hypothetical protein
MREIRKSGSEGGAVQMHCPYPYRSVGPLFNLRCANTLWTNGIARQCEDENSMTV